jgi:ComF family protein
MSLLDSLLQIIAPHTCRNCGREGELICSNCLCLLRLSPQTCYRCLRPTDNQFCGACSLVLPFSAIFAACEYSGLAKDLVWDLKYTGARAAAKEMAAIMYARLPLPTTDAVIVPAPTTSGRARQRGYDQAELLAKELSTLSGLPCQKLLRRTSKQHQVGASRQQRLEQMTGAFSSHGQPPLPHSVWLVDDVLTTGATLEAAATELRDAGVQTVTAAVFARA